MPTADTIRLYSSMLCLIVRMVEDANEDEDADPWDVLEDIQAAATDALIHAGFALTPEGVAAAARER